MRHERRFKFEAIQCRDQISRTSNERYNILLAFTKRRILGCILQRNLSLTYLQTYKKSSFKYFSRLSVGENLVLCKNMHIKATSIGFTYLDSNSRTWYRVGMHLGKMDQKLKAMVRETRYFPNDENKCHDKIKRNTNMIGPSVR
jgi:hypothetical protein